MTSIIQRIILDLARAGLPPAKERYYNPKGKYIGEHGGRFDIRKPGSAHHYISKSGKYLKIAMQQWIKKNGPSAAKANGIEQALEALGKETLTLDEVDHITTVAKQVLRKDLEAISKMPPQERKKYEDTYNKELKMAVRLHWNFTCPICGRTESELDETLNVHHVHGDTGGSFEGEDNPNEFVPVCDKCHKDIHKMDPIVSETIIMNHINQKMGGKSYTSPKDALPYIIHPPTR